MDDLISRQQAIDECYPITVDGEVYEVVQIETLMGLPSAQPERKDAIEKAVAVEAISDELMSRFDISATYAYEVAEKAMNRIEEMAKEMGKGEQDG